MSIETTHPPVEGPHGDDGGHHVMDPIVVERGQRLGVWLFIGGDIIIVSALLFTYLYLRGVDTSGHWMSMLGYQGHSYAFYQNLENSAKGIASPTLITVKPMSAGFDWLITLVTVVTAGIIWQGERALRATKNAKAYSSMAAIATVVTVVAIVLTVIQLRSIPEIFVATNDSQGMAYTAYDSAYLALVGSSLIHLVILGFLGLGLSIRSSRGLINGDHWYQARLARFFWVWIAISSVIVAAVTSTINTIH
jgi:heme/copper-type cytochrome/quinol oxidase subunit 3